MSRFYQQYRLLLWKNFVLKKRKPIATFVQLVVPLGIVIILVLVRNLNLKFNMDQCFLREKKLDSMGTIPFLRDFLCTFNSTCYNRTQINWNNSDTNEFLIFLNNVTLVYNTFPKEKLDFSVILEWVNEHHDEVQRLNYSIAYITNVSTPLIKDIQMVLSNDSSIMKKGIKRLSTAFCGFEENDLHLFIEFFFLNRTRSKREAKYCQKALVKMVGSNIYQIIAPVLFGKIYYAPFSNLTHEIVKRANHSFATLDNLRLASIDWQVYFKDWLSNELINGSFVENIRELSSKCQKFPDKRFSMACTQLNHLLKPEIIKTLLDNISKVFSMLEYALSCLELNKFVPLPTAADIANLASDSMVDLFAGLVFDPSFQYATRDNVTFLNYTIRMPTSRIDSTKRFKVLDKFWTPAPRVKTIQDMKYYSSGFLMLQESIDRGFIELLTDNGSSSVDVGSSVQIMPSPCYVDDRFIRFGANLMPFLLVISWSPIFSGLVKSIVYEKENRLKEFMLVMGLSPLVHWLAWFTISIATTAIPSILMTLIMHYRQILEFSSPGVVFLLLFSYTVSFISQAFMISVFFSKANVAAVVSGIVYFVFYIPFVVLINIQDDLTNTIYYFVSILSQVSFCNAVNFLAFWEQAKKGAQFSNLFESTVLNLNFGIGDCIVMLWVDTALYLTVTWYVEAVFPGEYGVPHSWYFFLTPSYWLPNRVRRRRNRCPSNIKDSIGPLDVNKTDFETVPDNLTVGISIENLTKKFPGAETLSVDNLSLNFYSSQITAFLGHNGAGKTTTISMLTGMIPPTSGTAHVLGLDIRTEIGLVRQAIGLCPQHNILFDSLSVDEHIYFYGRLRGMTAAEVSAVLPGIIEDVGLGSKTKTNTVETVLTPWTGTTAAGHLSGGMKRKLSVAMAFIGDCEAVFLDEPTAGVDPCARRGIWDLLVRYRRPGRTIVLTTHHMDEADYLSDRIAILARGRLRCCGSSVFLKRRFGDGYRLILSKSSESAATPSKGDSDGKITSELFSIIGKFVEGARLLEETSGQWTVLLPEAGRGLGALLVALDGGAATGLGVRSYGLADCSLEQVFLAVADDPALANGLHEDIDQEEDGDSDLQKTLCSSINSDHKQAPEESHDEPKPLLTGVRLLWQQLWALELRRLHHTRRSVKSLLCELVLPVLMVILMLTLLRSVNPFSNEPPMTIHPWLMMPRGRPSTLHTFYRPESDAGAGLVLGYRSDLGEGGLRCMDPSVERLPGLSCHRDSSSKWSKSPPTPVSLRSPECDCASKGYQVCKNPASGGPAPSSRVMASSDMLHDLSGYNITDFLVKRFDQYAQKLYGGYQLLLPSFYGQTCRFIGTWELWDVLRSASNGSTAFPDHLSLFFVQSGIRAKLARIWVNTKGYAAMSAYSNILSNLLLRDRLSSNMTASRYGISVTTHPFRYSEDDLESLLTKKMFQEVSLSNFVIVAMSLVPASFVLFLIEERVTGAKRQQFVSGVSRPLYWLSGLIWDFGKYLATAMAVLIVFFAFGCDSYIGPKNAAAFACLLAGYGLAIVPHMYPASFVLKSPSSAFVILAAYNMFVGSICTVTTFFLDQLQADEPSLRPVNAALKHIFILFPQYGLGRGMMDLSLSYMKYNISGGRIDYGAFDWDVTGQKLVSFVLLAIFWCAVVMVAESGLPRRILGRLCRWRQPRTGLAVSEEDADVALERHRVMAGTGADVLRVANLTKVYSGTCSRRGTIAVDNICFGVRAGECFGLLGVNGAGKTSTFRMLTGEERVTAGDASIGDQSVLADMGAAHRSMGFCPQTDALHALLTCEEELALYCRLRGVNGAAAVTNAVRRGLFALGLAPHAHKTTVNLSGGNRRKLSAAVALAGGPAVVVLDEPTSGMDAGARRALWRALRRLSSSTAVVLTSHNMEECEALCDRLAIMVGGRLRCLGSVQQLKAKFGDDYFVTLRMRADCDQSGQREKVKAAVEAALGPAGFLLKDENFVSVQYRVDPVLHPLATMFQLFEEMKEAGTIVDYSVSQTSLDDIFINFAREDDMSKIVSATYIRNVSNTDSRASYINRSFDEADETLDPIV